MNNVPNSPGGAKASLEGQAREHLAAGRWRKAREDYKLLCKTDRSKYLPLLIEANVGLAREMLARGLTSDAQQVVAYLKTFAPAEVMKGIELQLAASSGDTAQLLPAAVALLAGRAAALPAEERLRWADQLVVAFAPVPAQTPAETQLAAEVRAVHEALEAISAGQPGRALEAVRPLARDSAFSHWRVFIKGLVAFHSGEKEKAARCFEELPPESAPGRARESYQLLLRETPLMGRTASERGLDTATRLTGHAGWGRWLMRAEALWRAGKHADSYQTVRNALPSFPSEGLDLSGALSEFFFNAISTLDEDSSYAYEDFFLEIDNHNRAKSPTELKMIRRVLCLRLANQMESEQLKVKWEGFLRAHEELHGANPRLASLAYGWLGEIGARARPAGLFEPAGKPRLRDPAGAINALQRSVELDPANANAHLLLCAVYEARNMLSQRNRLLDVMTERFPDHKEVLLRAGAGCLDRKAFLKGIEYFERAWTLDRLDPKVPEFLVSGCLRLARQCFQKGRADAGRQALARAGELLVEQPDNLLRNPWCHWTRCGLFEQLYGDAAEGAERLAQARAASPFPAAFLLFAQLAWRLYAPENSAASPFEEELAGAGQANPNAAHAATLVRLWRFWRQAPDAPALTEEGRWLRRYLKSAAKNPLTRDEATQLVESLKDQDDLREEALGFTKAVLKKDPKDPLFRLYKHLLQPFRLRDPQTDREQVESILEEANHRGDQPASKQARELLAEMKALPARPFEPEPDEFDDDDPGFPPPDGPFQARSAMEDIIAMLSLLPDSQIRKIRKTPPKGIPAEVFDAVLATARGGKMPPLPPPLPKAPYHPTPPGKPPPLPPSDPNQMTLF